MKNEEKIKQIIKQKVIDQIPESMVEAVCERLMRLFQNWRTTMAWYPKRAERSKYDYFLQLIDMNPVTPISTLRDMAGISKNVNIYEFTKKNGIFKRRTRRRPMSFYESVYQDWMNGLKQDEIEKKHHVTWINAVEVFNELNFDMNAFRYRGYTQDELRNIAHLRCEKYMSSAQIEKELGYRDGQLMGVIYRHDKELKELIKD